MKRQITASTTIALQAAEPDTDLDRPLFAINYFNTRATWLYDFYNLLAARSVFAVGARIFFKGRLRETLLGEPALGRRLLLIVNYPNGPAFLDLMAGRYFQMVSLLRILAAKNFSFTLQRRLGGTQLLTERVQPLSAGKSYAIYHFQTDDSLEIVFREFNSMSSSAKLRIHYAGYIAANVAIEKTGRAPEAIEHIIRQLILVEADDEAKLRQFFQSDAFRKLATRNTQSYVGLLARRM